MISDSVWLGAGRLRALLALALAGAARPGGADLPQGRREARRRAATTGRHQRPRQRHRPARQGPLDGRGGNDLVNGGRDNDVVKGGAGDDVLCGGRGTDKLYGGPGDDIIYGEEENDTIFPGPGDDQVLGSAGDDRIFGYGERGGEIVDDGIDILDGGFNDDIIVAGGADTLLGFTHNDTLSTATPAVAPALMDGGGNDDIIYGSEVADNIRGGERLSGDDKLYGAGGNDKIFGDGNDDELYGQLGDDELVGGDGFDFLDGGPGDDSLRRRRPRRQRAATASATDVDRAAPRRVFWGL